MGYFEEEVPIAAYDRTIVQHVYMDHMRGSLLLHAFRALQEEPAGKTVLDVGAGTGQVVRSLKALQSEGSQIFACDVSKESQKFFADHPELKNIKFYLGDVGTDSVPDHFHVMTCVGVLHHIPEMQRSSFVSNMLDKCDTLILADEALEEYGSEEERLKNARSWYGFVIREARRRGCTELADLEEKFSAHEVLGTADDGMDYKQSLSALYTHIAGAGAHITALTKIGVFPLHKGGMYVASIEKYREPAL